MQGRIEKIHRILDNNYLTKTDYFYMLHKKKLYVYIKLTVNLTILVC